MNCFLLLASFSCRRRHRLFSSSFSLLACSTDSNSNEPDRILHSVSDTTPKTRVFISQKMPTRTLITVICILCAAVATALQIPFIPNVIIVPLSNSTSITVTNRTCDQCRCDSQASYAILNCFPNATCQFFVDAPRSYTVQLDTQCLPLLSSLKLFPKQVSAGCRIPLPY